MAKIPIDNCIEYKSGYKYQTTRQHVFQTDLRPPQTVRSSGGYVTLTTAGLLILARGYACDGATNFPDFDWIIRGAFIHDAIYLLIREELLPPMFKEHADRELRKCCREDGAWKWQAGVVYRGVNLFGGFGVDPENKRPIMTAPKCLAHGA